MICQVTAVRKKNDIEGYPICICRYYRNVHSLVVGVEVLIRALRIAGTM